jgi:branched-subunit amino acid transport protein
VIGSTAIVVSALVLGAGTFGYRFAGPLLRSRFAVPAPVLTLMSNAAVVLLVALMVTSAVTDGREPADAARPLGVLVGGVLAWRRAPFVVVVVAAAATASLLRLALG